MRMSWRTSWLWWRMNSNACTPAHPRLRNGGRWARFPPFPRRRPVGSRGELVPWAEFVDGERRRH
jgi:hypothetical protein